MEPLLDLKIRDRFGRRVLFGHVEQLGAWLAIAPPTTPGRRFAFLLLNGEQAQSVHEFSALADDLIDRGCAWFSSWGPGCELAHQIFDESVVGRGLQGPTSDLERIPDIMTTHHDQDSLEDVIWFFLQCTRLLPPRDEGVDTSIILACGDFPLCESALVAIAQAAL